MIPCRTRYDEKFTFDDKTRRAYSGFYSTFKDASVHQSKCRPTVAPRNAKSDVVALDMLGRTNIESAIRNLHVPLNKTNVVDTKWLEYKKYLKKSKSKNCTGWEDNNIDNKPTDQHTRLQLPMSNFKGMTTLDKVIVPYLHVNKQKGYADSDRFRFCTHNVSTRNIAKDIANNEFSELNFLIKNNEMDIQNFISLLMQLQQNIKISQSIPHNNNLKEDIKQNLKQLKNLISKIDKKDNISKNCDYAFNNKFIDKDKKSISKSINLIIKYIKKDDLKNLSKQIKKLSKFMPNM